MLNNHDKSLDTESLQTLRVECEAIFNSCPWMVDAISDVNNPVPLVPVNILIMKSKAILPPRGLFGRPGIFSKQRWIRVQHIANFCFNSISDRNRMASNKILKLVIYFFWNKTVNKMNGQWQELRRCQKYCPKCQNLDWEIKLRHSKSNFGKTSIQNRFASWKASLSQFPDEETWFKLILSSGEPVVNARSQKRHWNGVTGVHEVYDGEFVLNFKSCLSNIVITFNQLVLIKVWQTRSLSHLIIPLLWDNYLMTNSFLYLRKISSVKLVF